MMWFAPFFALTALLYASVGFGGGSTYTALLALADTDYQLLPIISLACNLVVVTGGVWRFARAGQIPWARVLPLCLLSVPLALLGGYLSVPEALFLGLLASSLAVAGLLLLFERPRPDGEPEGPSRSGAWNLGLGGGIGLLSGVVGIGGGIFLAPVLHLTRWGGARAIAGTASFFILVNSLAGIAGHLLRLDGADLAAASGFWPLLLAVLVGGAAGSRLGSAVLPQVWMKRLTAALILIVSGRLALRFFALMGSA